MKTRKVCRRAPIGILCAFVIIFTALTSVGCRKKEGAGLKYLGSFLSADVVVFIAQDITADDYYALAAECASIIEEYDKAFSLTREDGDVARFNAAVSGESVRISPLTARVVGKAFSYYEATDGAFDPAVFPLVDLWGFSYRFDALYEPETAYDRQRGEDGSLPLPDKEYVDAFIKLTDFSAVGTAVREDGAYLVKNCPSVTVKGTVYEQQIDLSAIAKGELSDALGSVISRFTKEFYISIGSSSIYLGEREGEKWTVSLVDPKSASRAAYGEVELKNVCVSTSGTYENTYETDGKKYHHVIDPATGSCANTDILSVAVIGDNGGECDALSTALVVMGFQKASEFIKTLPDRDFVFVTEDGKIHSTVSLKIVGGDYKFSELCI